MQQTLSAIATWLSRNWRSILCLLIWLMTLIVGQAAFDSWMQAHAGLLAVLSSVVGTLLPMTHGGIKRSTWPPTQ